MKLTQGMSLKFLFCLVLLLSGCGFLPGLTTKPTMLEMKSLGKLTVGKPLPSYTGGTRTGRAKGTKPSKGDYLVHLLHPKLPTDCMDEECGWLTDKS